MDTVHVFVNHWQSRVGGEQRSAPGREAAAQVDKTFIDSIQKYKPDAKIIVMGDLNDDPINESIAKVLGAKGRIEDVKPGGLYNPWVDMYKKGIGTLAYQDAWGLYDHIIISYSWLNKTQSGTSFISNIFLIKNTWLKTLASIKVIRCARGMVMFIAAATAITFQHT